MTEQKNEHPAPKFKRCGKCGRVIGELVVIEEVEWLVISGQVIRYFNAVCECGNLNLFSVSDHMMEKILHRNRRHKEDLLSHKT